MQNADAQPGGHGGSAQKQTGGGGRNTPTLNGGNDGEGTAAEDGKAAGKAGQVASDQNMGSKRQIQFGNLLDLSQVAAGDNRAVVSERYNHERNYSFCMGGGGQVEQGNAGLTSGGSNGQQ